MCVDRRCIYCLAHVHINACGQVQPPVSWCHMYHGVHSVAHPCVTCESDVVSLMANGNMGVDAPPCFTSHEAAQTGCGRTATWQRHRQRQRHIPPDLSQGDGSRGAGRGRPPGSAQPSTRVGVMRHACGLWLQRKQRKKRTKGKKEINTNTPGESPPNHRNEPPLPKTPGHVPRICSPAPLLPHTRTPCIPTPAWAVGWVVRSSCCAAAPPGPGAAPLKVLLLYSTSCVPGLCNATCVHVDNATSQHALAAPVPPRDAPHALAAPDPPRDVHPDVQNATLLRIPHISAPPPLCTFLRAPPSPCTEPIQEGDQGLLELAAACGHHVPPRVPIPLHRLLRKRLRQRLAALLGHQRVPPPRHHQRRHRRASGGDGRGIGGVLGEEPPYQDSEAEREGCGMWGARVRLKLRLRWGVGEEQRCGGGTLREPCTRVGACTKGAAVMSSLVMAAGEHQVRSCVRPPHQHTNEGRAVWGWHVGHTPSAGRGGDTGWGG